MTIKHLINAFCFSLLAGTASAELKPLDSIAAIVDDDIIMKSEIDDRVEVVKTQSRGVALPPDDILSSQVLERLISESIQLQMADRSGMRVSDQELNKTIENIAKQNGMSFKQFKAALEKDGVDYLDAREQIRRERIISQVQRYRVGSKIQISDQDVEGFLKSIRGKKATAEEYKLRHILVQVPSQASRAELRKAESRANKIVKQLRDGADFKKTAIAQSDGRNALKGGDLGWRKQGELPSLFSDIVPALAAGEASQPIKSGSGYHIIMVEEKRGGASKVVKQTRARHILIQATEIRDEAASKSLINNLYKRIQNGEDFAELAKEFSDDPGSKVSGGDLDWINEGDMVPEFEKTMKATKKGQLSKPFKSQFGWHILEVTDYRDKDLGDQIQRNQARQLLFAQRFEEELPIWLRQIRTEAYVELK